MPKQLPRFLTLLVLAAASLTAGSRPALAGPGPFGQTRVQIDLVSRSTSAEPGSKTLVGLRLRHEEHWHTYWKFGGDGDPTKVTWTLPPGWTAGEIRWPAPTRIVLPGSVAGYVYEGEVLLPVELTIPAQALEAPATIRARVVYQVCDSSTCDQGSMDLELSVVVAKVPPKDGPLAAAFLDALDAGPQPLPDGAALSARGTDGAIELRLSGPGPWTRSGAELLYFATEARVIEFAADQATVRTPEAVTLSIPRAKRRAKQVPQLTGLLVVTAEGRRHAYDIDLPLAWEGAAPAAPAPAAPAVAVPSVASPSGTGVAPAPAPAPAPAEPAPGRGVGGRDDGEGTWKGFSPEPGSDLWRFAGLDLDADGICRDFVDDELAPGKPTLIWLLLLAFLGGAILNLMPCVLPVLSVKILGFVSQAGDEPARARRHGYAFALGVLASFWLLAGILIALRVSGEKLGWGFQLQQPGFVAGLAVLMTAVGLNLFGVFEVGASVMNLAGEASTRIHATGYASSFWSGALATAIATPCTAPFMGPAVGYAVTAPPLESLLLFTALGLGMSAPYVVLSASPRLLKKVPRPGPWMDTFKHALAFPMFAVALYLAWVFGKQTGVDGAIRLLFGLLTVSVALWIYGRWGGPEQAPRRRLILGRLTPLAFVLLGALYFIAPATGERPPPRGASGEWEDWAPPKVAWNLSQGRAVFVDFTADWCLSCKANERAFLDTDTVRAATRQHGIVLLKGDWTLKDAAMYGVMQSFRRTSVPLYVVYSPYRVPHVLGSAITAGGVADAIAQAATR